MNATAAHLLSRAADLIRQAQAEAGVSSRWPLLPDAESGLREISREMLGVAELDDLPADFPVLDLEAFEVPDGCLACRGVGCVQDGGRHQGCWACGGKATAGVYVVQIVAGSARKEIDKQTKDYHKAVRLAERAARLVALRVGQVTVDTAEVVYVPLGEPRRARKTVREVPVPVLRRAERIPA